MFTHIETLIALATTGSMTRGVRLTPAGHRLPTHFQPLVASLRQALQEEELQTGGRLEIGVSESILASWGPRVLAGSIEPSPNLSSSSTPTAARSPSTACAQVNTR